MYQGEFQTISDTTVRLETLKFSLKGSFLQSATTVCTENTPVIGVARRNTHALQKAHTQVLLKNF